MVKARPHLATNRQLASNHHHRFTCSLSSRRECTSTIAIGPVLALLASCSGDGPLGHAGLSIVHGEPTSDFPAVLMLQKRKKGVWGGLCSATVVGPKHLLTAAHCVDNDVQGPQTDDIVDGVRINVGGDLANGPWIEAESWAVPMGYGIIGTPVIMSHDEELGLHVRADVAVVKLAEPLDIQPLPLGTEPPAVGQEVTLVGWGGTKAKILLVDGGPRYQDQGELLAYGAPVDGGVKRETRNRIDRLLIDDFSYNFKPADSDGGTICFGDSGGPALSRGPDGGWNVVGLHSLPPWPWCATRGNDTVVMAYYRWLAEQGVPGVPGVPELELSTSRVRMSATRRGDVSAPGRVEVHNLGSGQLPDVSHQIFCSRDYERPRWGFRMKAAPCDWLTVRRDGQGDGQVLVNTVDATGLNDGFYVAWVLVSAPGSAAQKYNVELTVGAPRLTVRGSTAFAAKQGGLAVPEVQDVMLYQHHSGPLAVNIAHDVRYEGAAGWLEIAHVKDDAGYHLRHRVVNAEALPPGTQRATVTLTPEGFPEAAESYDVTLSIDADGPLDLRLSAPSIELESIAGWKSPAESGSSAARMLVQNSGSGSLRGRQIELSVAGDGGAAWLRPQLRPTSATRLAWIDNAVDISTLPAGRYEARVTVRVQGAEPLSYPVILNLVPRGQVSIDPPGLALSGVQGERISGVITVSGPGVALLGWSWRVRWSAEGDTNWFGPKQNDWLMTHARGATIEHSAKTDGLPPGTYTARVQLTLIEGLYPDGPWIFEYPVSLEVKPRPTL